MTQYSYNENLKELNLLAPQNIVATATASAYIDVTNAVSTIQFKVPFGTLTTTDSTGEITVTLEASTAGSSNATEVALSFRYRLSAAVATDTMGAISSAVSSVVVANTDDDKTLDLFVEPSVIAAAGADYRYLRVVITPTGDLQATFLGGVHCRYVSRYAGNSITSST